MCVCVFICVCTHEFRCLKKPENCICSPRTGVTGACEPPNVKANHRSSEHKAFLLTTPQPSLQPCRNQTSVELLLISVNVILFVLTYCDLKISNQGWKQFEILFVRLFEAELHAAWARLELYVAEDKLDFRSLWMLGSQDAVLPHLQDLVGWCVYIMPGLRSQFCQL